MTALPSTTPASAVATPVSLAEATRVWFRIGWLSFGGPAAQIALMHRELIERRRWISEGRFLHALNYCMLLPGPEAQQLAVYIGWLMNRFWGGVIAGVLFILPGLITIFLLSVLYVGYRNFAPVAALFFGLKAAVLAIVVEAILRIGRRALKNHFMVGIAAAAFIAIYFFKVPFPVIIVGAAVTGMLARHMAPGLFPTASDTQTLADNGGYVIDRLLATGQAAHTQPSTLRSVKVLGVCVLLWLLPMLAVLMWLGPQHILVREGLFFSQMALVTFGGAYAVLAYVAQHAVEYLHWIRPGEMLDGLALAETTPGPLIMVVQFVGFLAAYRFPAPLDPWVAATLGALLTTWVTFLPSFLFVFLGAPYIESLRRRAVLSAALSAITAAVVGVILNLSVWFAVRTLFTEVSTKQMGLLQLDVPNWSSLEPGALTLTVLAMVAVLRFKLGLGWVLLGCGVLGVLYGMRDAVF